MIKRLNEPVLEFSRPCEVARIPKLGSHEKLNADAGECKALANRVFVPVIHTLTAELKVKPWRGGGLKVSGELKADLEQQSVVSLEDFRSTVVFPIERYFLNVPASADIESEADIDPIVDGTVDLGEVVAETLALELDPYPRKPGEVFQDAIVEEPQLEEKKTNPFNVLKLEPRKK